MVQPLTNPIYFQGKKTQTSPPRGETLSEKKRYLREGGLGRQWYKYRRKQDRKMADFDEKHPEKYELISEEEEQFELPEDRCLGQLRYFTTVWIFTFEWTLCYVKSFVFLPMPFVWVTIYFEVWSIFTIVLVMFANHCLFSVIAGIIWTLSYKQNFLDKETLQLWLGEVGDADLGDPMAWRKIAYRVNQTKPHHDPFYSGSECRKVFVRQVVKPVDHKTYKIWSRRNAFFTANLEFCADPSNKVLVQRAVENYKKSIQFSETKEEEKEEVDVAVADDVSVLLAFTLLICVIEFLAITFFVILYSIKGLPWERTE